MSKFSREEKYEILELISCLRKAGRGPRKYFILYQGRIDTQYRYIIDQYNKSYWYSELDDWREPISLESFLDDLSPEIQIELLFHLDLFRKNETAFK